MRRVLRNLAGLLLVASATSCAFMGLSGVQSDDVQQAAERIIGEVWGSDTLDAASTVANWSSPEVRRLTRSMTARFIQLQEAYDNGQVGLTADGYIDVTEIDRVPLPERNGLRAVIANENADRAALYQAVATAEGRRGQEAQVRQLFAHGWLTHARPGWRQQAPGGGWEPTKPS